MNQKALAVLIVAAVVCWLVAAFAVEASLGEQAMLIFAATSAAAACLGGAVLIVMQSGRSR